jgi:hypothetical protein
MKKKIYLDDVRTPIDKEDWVIVRNYDEFVDKVSEICLEKNKSKEVKELCKKWEKENAKKN